MCFALNVLLSILYLALALQRNVNTLNIHLRSADWADVLMQTADWEDTFRQTRAQSSCSADSKPANGTVTAVRGLEDDLFP